MKVLVFGNANADINVSPVNRLDSMMDLIYVDDIDLYSGGNAMTTSIVLKKLGVDCTLATYVGGADDIFSSFLMRQLNEVGVDTSLITAVEGETCGIVIVMVNDNGKRSFLYKSGVQNQMILDQHVLDKVSDYDVVSINGTFHMPKFDGVGTKILLEAAKAKGKITAMDITPDMTGQWLNTIGQALPYCDYFIPSYLEASAMTGENEVEAMAEILLSKGVSTVIIKLDKNGCYYDDKKSKGIVPAFPIKAINTTGAGDSFCAGFISTLGNEMHLVERLKFANAVAALSCLGMGAVGTITDKKGVDLFIEKFNHMNR